VLGAFWGRETPPRNGFFVDYYRTLFATGRGGNNWLIYATYACRGHGISGWATRFVRSHEGWQKACIAAAAFVA
jgi:hypothetical protein